MTDKRRHSDDRSRMNSTATRPAQLQLQLGLQFGKVLAPLQVQLQKGLSLDVYRACMTYGA